MKKLDHLADDDLLQAFRAEKLQARHGQATGQPGKPVPQADDARAVAVRQREAELKEQAARHDAERREEAAQREAELSMLRTACATAEARVDALAAERDAARRAAAEAERAQREADRRAAEASRRAQEQAQVIERWTARGQLWARRGLCDAEIPRAFAGLAAAKPAALLDALHDPEAAALAQLLTERLALVCEAPACQPVADAVVVLVPAERCEQCGGSDLRVAYRQFAEAMQRKSLAAVTIVGGSPAYRETLRRLHRELKAPFSQDLVPQQRPDEGKRAASRRGLVVIWGGTELDHVTSWHYQGAGDTSIRINHRGLVGLLNQMAEYLRTGVAPLVR